MSKDTVLGIHKTLLSYTLVATVAGGLVMGMGILLLSNILFPAASLLFGEVKGLGSKLAFVGFGSLLAVFGLFVTLKVPYRSLRNTKIVVNQKPERVRLKLREKESSDSTSLYIELQEAERKQASYLAKHPTWFNKDYLHKSLEAEGYFDAKRNLVAIKLEKGLIWVLS